MADEEEAIQIFVAWADIPSAFLLAASIALGGLTPVRPLWGRSPLHNVVFTTVMLLQAAYTLARFVIEGAYRESGPREFMASSVIYTTRWVFLWAHITFNRTQHGRLFRVARELRRVKMLRYGRSTDEQRKGEQELVMRYGCRDAGQGAIYWRGIVESIKCQQSLWVLHLRQSELHAEILDDIGTTEFRMKKSFHQEQAYELFYKVVMTAALPGVSVDYGQFLDRFEGVPVTRIAQRAHADDPSVLGHIARKIAADGTYYASNAKAEMRTREQVNLLNICIQDAFDRIADGGPVQMGNNAV